MKKGTLKISMAVCMVACIVMSLFSLPTVNAATKSLSSKAKKEYANILWYSQYLDDSEHFICQGSTFVLYDINKDGQKELMVSGPLGLRNVMYTMIYSYNGKKMNKNCIRGDVIAVSSNGIAVADTDYSGSEYYEDTVVYTFDKNCKGNRKITKAVVYDMENDSTKTEYRDGSNKAITKQKFNAEYKKYKLKTVGKSVKSFSASNRLDIIKALGVKTSPKLSNGSYESTHHGNDMSVLPNLENPQNCVSCYKAQIKNNQLIIYGNYGKNGKNPTAIGTYTFKLAPNCKIVKQYDVEEEATDIKFFNNCFNNTKYAFCFSFTIKNGKVVKIQIAC